MGLALLGLGVLFPSTFTSFTGNGGAIIEQMPRGMQAFLKTQGDLTPLLGAEGYMAVGYRHPIYLIVIAAFTISAGSALAREIEKGTVFLVLARPLQRYSLVLAKGTGLLAGLITLLGAALAGTALGVTITDLDQPVRLSRFLLISFNALLLFLAIGGYGFLIAALSSEGSRAIVLATGLTVAFFFIDYIVGLGEPLEFLAPLTIFNYYDPIGVVQQGSVPLNHLLVLLAVAAAGFAATIAVFQRRDIP